mgnify:CR=1 FL=1
MGAIDILEIIRGLFAEQDDLERELSEAERIVARNSARLNNSIAALAAKQRAGEDVSGDEIDPGDVDLATAKLDTLAGRVAVQRDRIFQAFVAVTAGLQPDQPTRGAGAGGAPRLEERIDWEAKLQTVQRIEQRVTKGATLEQACQLEGTTPRTYHRWRQRLKSGDSN